MILSSTSAFYKIRLLRFSLYSSHDKSVAKYKINQSLYILSRGTTNGNGIFHTLNKFLEDTEDVRHDGNVKSKIINSLQSLRYEFVQHFPNTITMIWHSLEICIWSRIQILSAYCSAMILSYPRVASEAIPLLILFPSTWLCEAGFSALLNIKDKARNKPIKQKNSNKARSKVCCGNNRATHRQAYRQETSPDVSMMLLFA